LSSSGFSASDPQGRLSIAAGAVIDLDPTATLSLTALNQLRLDGRIVAPGGKVSLGLTGNGNVLQPRLLWIGGSAGIDVA
ncbi:hypothetical protein ACSTG8_23700, partial [Vibrio parahaemolyticus]